jgi:HAD superfamily hydrolase (TIGR01459 family)
MTQILDGLASLASAYRWAAVDQWGVLHNGHRLLPGALEALREMRAAGWRVALVSNSSHPEGPSRRLLRELGVADVEYDALITAGELGARYLRGRLAAGERPRVWPVVLPFGPDSVVSALGLPIAASLQEADLLVASGTRPEGPDMEILRVGVARGLPMLCLNPDRRSVQPDGSFWWCPGAFAARYAELGGQVKVWGKPGGEIYAAAVAALFPNGEPPGPGLGIGDSLEHDVAGALHNGLDALFITGGIHWEETGERPEGEPVPARLHARLAEESARPQYAMGRLRW